MFNLHFYIHFYKQLKASIKSNRHDTISCINKNKLLISLHKSFTGYIDNHLIIELNLI